MGLVGTDRAVRHLRLGYETASALHDELLSLAENAHEADWYPDLRERLQDYAAGEKVSFASVRVEFPPVTPFQSDVLRFVQKIPFGRVMTYGEVAAAVGKPGAARAVGTVMSQNRVPILIPCHRVIAAGGKLGGYSAPQGIGLKRWLLDLERRATPQNPR
jgi:methylated-DNA-[protein]-cysteine S-methyltransferase